MTTSTTKPILFFLLALALVRGIIYASMVPPWQAPDEPPQFERAKAALVAKDWSSTAKDGPEWYGELIRSLFAFNYFDFLDTPRQTYSADSLLNRYIDLYQEAYGGLYGSRATYALIGWPLLLVSKQNITLELYVMRLNTVLMSVGIVLLAYVTTRIIFPQEPFLFLGVPILVLFNPQHTHMLSTVNNGNLAELLASVALFFIVRGIIKGFSWLNVILILGFSLVAMWTKATAYFLLGAIATTGLLYLWQYRQQWRWLLPGGAIFIGLTYLLAPTRLKLLIKNTLTLIWRNDIYLDPIVPKDLFRSFWAMPGWTIFQLHPFWYLVLMLGCILAVVGLVFLLISEWQSILSGRYEKQIQALMVMAAAIVVSISILLGWNAVLNIIIYRQGRSIYPVIVPITIFLVLGWRQLIPYNWRKVGLLVITSAILLLDSLVLFHYTIPFFYSSY